MKKVSRKTIKTYVTTGAAVDVTNMDHDKIYELIRNHDLEKLYYSTGINGINGALLRDRDNGTLYAVTARNSALYMLV